MLKRVRRSWLQNAFLFAGCLSAAAGASGADVLREDLSAVKLPHGELVLPNGQGLLLHLSDGKLAPHPALAPGKTAHDLIAAMREANTGDLDYLGHNTLLVVSGTASDLGEHYLYDFNDPPPPAPKEVPADPAQPRSLPGVFHGIKEGHVFSVVTTDGKYAIVRLLRIQTDGALIQYIYQPDGTLQFDVPKSQPLALPPTVMPVVSATPPANDVVTTPAPASPTIAAAPGTTVPPTMGYPGAPVALSPAPAAPAALTPMAAAPVTLPLSAPRDTTLVPYLSAHLAQRQKLIEQRLNIVKITAHSEGEISAKNSAIDDLGELAAPEAVDTLIDQITFFNSLARSRQSVVEVSHPAVAALRKIGKPASLAALKAINQLPLQPAPGDDDPLHAPSYRLWLLTLVIQGVEGTDTTEFMLTRAKEKADEAHRPVFDQALKYLREP